MLPFKLYLLSVKQKHTFYKIIHTFVNPAFKTKIKLRKPKLAKAARQEGELLGEICFQIFKSK